MQDVLSVYDENSNKQDKLCGDPPRRLGDHDPTLHCHCHCIEGKKRQTKAKADKTAGIDASNDHDYKIADEGSYSCAHCRPARDQEDIEDNIDYGTDCGGQEGIDALFSHHINAPHKGNKRGIGHGEGEDGDILP